MKLIQSLTARASAAITAAGCLVLSGLQRHAADRERGDVPGWVLITLMTAGLVTLLWSLAATQMTALFSQAMHSVTGP